MRLPTGSEGVEAESPEVSPEISGVPTLSPVRDEGNEIGLAPKFSPVGTKTTG